MYDICLPPRSVIGGPFPQQIADAENGCEWVVQLMRHAGNHLADSGEFFGLQQLLLEPQRLGDVPRGGDNADDFSFRICERTGMRANRAPTPLFMRGAIFYSAYGHFAAGQPLEKFE